MITGKSLKEDLANALNVHMTLLKDVESIDNDHLDAYVFMMHSFGFMLDGAPRVLIGNDDEELMYMMFQYYSLLNELKYNILLNFPYAHLQGRKLIEVVDDFPTTYEREMKQWWERLTGLAIEETKQTITIKELEYE